MARGRKSKRKDPRTYKKPNGFGTVYEIKTGNRRKPFVACVTDGWDITIDKNGNPRKRQKKHILGCAETYEKGMEMLIEYHKKRKAGLEIVKSDSTFSEIYNTVLPRRLEGKSDSLKRVYQAAFKQLSPLHDVSISDIKAGTMQKIIDQAKENGKRYETLNNIKIVCKMIFEYAIQNDLVEKDYASFIKLPPRNERVINRSPFSDEDILTLWNTDKEYIDTILILIYTGMRINELLKIKTKDVHLEKRYIVTGSKTQAGNNRIIPIAKPIENLIKKHYNINNEYLLLYEGKQISPNIYRTKIWDPLMEKLNMTHLPHDCRHTFCSITDRGGMERLIQQKIIGHKASNITENIYIHKNLQDLVAAVDKIWPSCVSYVLVTDA